MKFTAQQIAQLACGTVEGDANVVVDKFAKIEEGTQGALSFLANPKYEHYLYETGSSVVLVNNDFQPSDKVNATLIRVPNAYEAIAKLLNIYQQMQPKRAGIDSKASVSDSAQIGEDCYIGPFAVVDDGAVIGRGTQIYPHAYIGQNVKVGDDCTINANVSVYHDCRIGNRCILHSGCVVGADGFGFAPTATGYDKIEQIGIVEIGDDVEVGANTCIDRSTMGSTKISNGVKLDNLVQIGHNVEVGPHTVLCAQVGVAGSAKIGQWCTLAGQVGVAGHISVADKTTSGAQAGIAGPVKQPGTTIIGSPAIDYKTFMRSSVVFKYLPEMKRKLDALCKDVEELKTKKPKIRNYHPIHD